MRTIRIQVKPGSHQNEIIQQTDGTYLVRVKARPIDSQANKAVIELLSKHFRIAKTRFQIKNGASSHHKTVVIDD